jgi:ATP/maltotriose-dependent transcriptional regulator MalT
LTENSKQRAYSANTVQQNEWGQFCFTANWLEPQDASGQKLIGITVERQIPLIICLAKNIGQQPLSPRQKEISLLMTYGYTPSAIAERLKVSQHTVGGYIINPALKYPVLRIWQPGV